jgi:Beta-galactosidase/beta-glucuronidase
MNCKRILVALIALSTLTSLFALTPTRGVREEQLFNFGWKFKWGEVTNGQKVNLDDSNWRNLDLPHDFQFEQPWDKTAVGGRGFKQMGTGWYRKSFKADATWKGKKILLDFEGIMLLGEVWLNGKKVGETDYGYLGFDSDISQLLRYDSLNIVAVRATTGNKGSSRWYTGGGLFRDVHLVVKDPVSIIVMNFLISTKEKYSMCLLWQFYELDRLLAMFTLKYRYLA